MLKMLQRTPHPQRRGRTLLHPAHTLTNTTPTTPTNTRRGTSGPAILPELAQFLAHFGAGAGPVVADVVAQLGDVAAQFEFVLLEPRDVEFLAGGAALELPGDVFLVVADDSEMS